MGAYTSLGIYSSQFYFIRRGINRSRLIYISGIKKIGVYSEKRFTPGEPSDPIEALAEQAQTPRGIGHVLFLL